MEFKHISDCWIYLEQAEDYDDLICRIGEIPNKFGDWEVEPNEYRECRIINSYYDEICENWDQDIEDTNIPFPKFDDDEEE